MRCESPIAKMIRQLLPSAMQPSFDGSGRHVHELRDLTDAQFLLVKHDETVAVFCPEQIQSQLDFFSDPDVVRLVFDLRFRERYRRHRNSLTFLDECTTAVGGDLHDPGRQRLLRIPTAEVFDRAQKGILSRIFRILAMTKHAKAENENAVLEQPDELPESIGVARQTALNELNHLLDH